MQVLYVYFACFGTFGVAATSSLEDDVAENYTLYDVIAFNERDRALLYNFHVNLKTAMFYNYVTNQAAIPMKVLVRNKYTKHFEQILDKKFIQFFKLPQGYLTRKHGGQPEFSNFELDPSKEFLSYENIDKWITKRALESSLMVRRSIGITYEKREILLMKISAKRRKCAVFIVGGQIGRDRISTAVILNYVNLLTRSAPVVQGNMRGPPKQVSTLLDYFDLYVIPLLNPDGYSYSMDDVSFWMKNRKIVFPRKLCSNGRDAIGVNLDRNWHLIQEFSTDTECSGVHVGNSPISEKETKSLFNALNSNAIKTIAFICVQGFGQMITIPYATQFRKAVNHELMMEILPYVTDQLEEKYNKKFFYGTTATYLYNYSGNVADYVKLKLNIPIVYTLWLSNMSTMFPNEDDIPMLTKQFGDVLNHTLMLAKDIYGPLFNKQINNIAHVARTFFFVILSQVTY